MLYFTLKNTYAVSQLLRVYDPRAADFFVYAASDNYVMSLMTWLIRVLAGILYVPAIINIIRSFTDYQEAKADGSGSAADKAKNELVVGLMLILLASVIITSAAPLAKAFLGT